MTTGEAILLAVGRAVKACVAHGAKACGRCVPQDAGDESVGVQTQRLAATVAMIGVVKAHQIVGVDGQGAVVGQRAALDVASQIQGQAASVVIGGLDLDIPVRTVQLADAGVPVGGWLLGWQAQVGGDESAAQPGQELAAEQKLQRFEGEQELGVAALPKASRVDAAGGEQAVHMRMPRQSAAPGMQGHDQACTNAQALGVGHEFKQSVTHAVEQQ